MFYYLSSSLFGQACIVRTLGDYLVSRKKSTE